MTETEKSDPKPVAWMFYDPDGRVRFVIHDEERYRAWAKHHTGKIVALVPAKEGTA